MYTTIKDTPMTFRRRYDYQDTDGNTAQLFFDATVTERDFKSGSKMPYHADVIKKGLNATTDYIRDSTRLSIGSMTQTTKWTKNGSTPNPYVETHTISGQMLLVDAIAHLEPDESGLKAGILQKVYDRLREQNSYMNGLNTLGELRETVAMLRNPLNAIKSNIVKVVSTEKQKISAMAKYRLERDRRRAFSDMVSGTALEINFGWAPLFSEVADIASTIAKTQYRPPSRDRLTAAGQVSAASVDTIDRYRHPNPWNAPFYYNIVDKRVTEKGFRYTIGLSTAVSADYSAVGRVLDNFGVTPGNILPTLYELTPWSWLLDYFTNVGGIIEAGCTGTSFVAWVSESVRTKTVLTRQSSTLSPSPLPDNPNDGYYSSFSGGGSTSIGTRTSLYRNRLTELPLPPFTFKNPFNSATKVTNVLSVMAQQRRSGMKLFTSSDSTWLD